MKSTANGLQMPDEDAEVATVMIKMGSYDIPLTVFKDQVEGENE